MMNETYSYLRINEIKNYVYCPRISYYNLCLHTDRETDLSRAGVAAEGTTKQKMKRRKYALHSVHDGERQFDVPVVSHTHRIVGRLDEVVITSDGIYLVDYKDTEKDYGYWRIQMCAYMLAAQEMGNTVLGVYVYSIPQKCYTQLHLIDKDTNHCLQILEALRRMVTDEICPEPAPQIAKCRVCQYSRWCNDVF
jgi:CRISPR-associated protein Cas4